MAARADDRESLSARLEIPGGRIYVGQVVDAAVLVVAGTTPPGLIASKSPDLDVTPLSRVLARPRSMTKIGDAVDAETEFTLPVRIVARRAGRLALPAIRVVAGDRSGLVPSRTIVVSAVPSAGRTGTFLGGVGPIVATAEASPATIRLGDTFEFRLRLDGVGAVGSIAGSPIPGRVLGLGERVEAMATDFTIDPPSRTFRVRVRPAQAGEGAILPVRVSWFDPDTGRFQTAVTRAQKVRVVATPDFDPGRLSVPPAASPPGRGGWALGIGGGGLALSAVAVLALRWRMARSRRVDPSREASALIAKIRRAERPEEAGRAATDAVASFLHRVAGRPPGVLTPAEARSWVARVADDRLADRAERLIAECDRVAYGNSDASREVKERAIAFLVDLAGAVRTQTPGEAPETA